MDDKTVTTKPQQTAMATMPPADRAYLALSEKHDEQALIELAGKYRDATEIKDKTDYAMIMRGGIELQKVRVAIEKTGKAARQDANDFRTAVLTEQKRLIDIIEPEEKRLRQLRADYDAELERKAEEARMLEQRRISDITDRIRSIEKQVDGLLGADAAAIRLRLESVRAIECSEVTFAEFSEEASDVQARVCSALETALQERSEFEARQAENERIAKEQAARQAELDRQAEEQRERERAAQEKIDAERRENARIMREGQEREEAERERVRGREQCLADIKASADGAACISADDIRGRISALDQTDLSIEVWQEFQGQAQKAVSDTLVTLEKALKERVKLDEDKADLERREAENLAEEERRRAEEEARAQAEREDQLRPDKEKLMEWAEYLDGMRGPDVSDDQLTSLRGAAEMTVSKAGSILMRALNDL